MASSVIGDWVVKISVDGGGFTSGVSTVATSAATANETIAAQTSAIEANFDHISASATSAQSAVVAAAALGRCAEKIRELSGRTKKEMEDIAKNSSTIQTSGSGSS